MEDPFATMAPQPPSRAEVPPTRGGALLAGAIAGAAGAFVMSRFRVLRQADDVATVAVAQAVAHSLLRRRLTPRELAVVIPALRYSYGSAAGAAFALLRPRAWNAATSGAALGLALWVASDLVIIPAIRRFDAGAREPDPGAAISVLYHLVFGVTAGMVQRRLEALTAAAA
jgi:hypothetical protein